MRRGLYIHIPYCRRKCIYCDFFSQGDRRADWNTLTSALINEFQARSGGEPYATIYIGGGTPSLMPMEELRRLTDAVTASGMPEEFTIEVNPDDVTEEMAVFWKSLGINRVSMGIQSFSDKDLKFLNRRHTAGEAIEAYHLLRKHFDNISIDLIFGLPNRSMDEWTENIRTAVSLKPEHISAYNLMYEEGTPLTLMRNQGRVEEIDDETTLRMYDTLHSMLQEEGYLHYEISNFCKPEFQSRHNSQYWDGTPYLGIGPGAHSYDGERIRSSNLKDIPAYEAYYVRAEGKKPIGEEHLIDEELIEEHILTRLRTAEGLSLSDFRNRYGDKEFRHLMHLAEKEEKIGNVIIKDDNLIIPPDRWMISDSIIASLL